MFDFAIKFETLTELNMTKPIPTSVDVMVEDYMFEVLKENSVINEKISFKIW